MPRRKERGESMKIYTYQEIIFVTLEAEDEEDACIQLDNMARNQFELDEDSPRLYEGEYNSNTYKNEEEEAAE